MNIVGQFGVRGVIVELCAMWIFRGDVGDFWIELPKVDEAHMP